MTKDYSETKVETRQILGKQTSKDDEARTANVK